jgi:hypothetical protein
MNAPDHMAAAEGKRTFEETFNKGIGEGYAIARGLAEQCRPGLGVVLLSKDGKKRAEGTLVKLVPTEKAGNGMQRYDVYMDALKKVPYQPENLNRNGIAVIERP